MHDRLQIFEGYVMRSRVYNLQNKVSARLPFSLLGLQFMLSHLLVVNYGKRRYTQSQIPRTLTWRDGPCEIQKGGRNRIGIERGC